METTRAQRLYYLIGILSPSVADSFLVGFYTIYLLRYLTLTEIGIQYAFWLLVLALADFPTGALADFWGARNCMILSYGLMICAYLGLLLVESLTIMLLPLFFAIHFFFAVSAAQESGTLVAWFTNHWKANNEDMMKLREVFGRANAYTLAATTLASITGGFLAAYLTISLVFIGALGYCVVGTLAATHLTRPQTSQARAERTYLSHTRRALAVFRAEQRLILLIFISCLNYVGWFLTTYLVIQPIIYQDLEAIFLEITPGFAISFEKLFVLVLLTALFSAARVLGYHYAGRIQRFRDINAALILFFPIPCCYILLFLCQAILPNWALGVTIIGAFLIGFATGLYNPHIMQFYQRLVPSDHRAAILSLRSTAVTATTIVFTAAGGALLQQLGLEYGFLLAGAFGLAAFALIGVVRHLSPDDAQFSNAE